MHRRINHHPIDAPKNSAERKESFKGDEMPTGGDFGRRLHLRPPSPRQDACVGSQRWKRSGAQALTIRLRLVRRDGDVLHAPARHFPGAPRLPVRVKRTRDQNSELRSESGAIPNPAIVSVDLARDSSKNDRRHPWKLNTSAPGEGSFRKSSLHLLD